ncbi:hypothetical protein AB0K00_45870 [Dactylosporangium sp. NPDC049525]|uniref:WXG100-like domain-containing protein n=1 Tax=Dactylosporangium sp. NPDC049525 TaxID=3154730 RepID=UPI0034359A56
MGLQLPGELRAVLSLIGYEWPQADEQKLFEMGQVWTRFAGTIQHSIAEADPVAAAVWTQNVGADITAFRASWEHEDGPSKALHDGATAAQLAGLGLMVCGLIVLALKVAVIIQLVILAIEIAQAIATSELTFGASLLEIPVFQQLTRTVVSNLLMEALFMLADG